MRILMVLAALSAASALAGPQDAAKARFVISLRKGEAEKDARFLVAGGKAALAGLKSAKTDQAGFQRIFSVYVVVDGRRAKLPLFGEYRIAGDALAFTPRFPLNAGMSYQAVFHPGRLPGQGNAASSPAVEKLFTLPAPPKRPPGRVAGVFPSRDALPENLLKFYLHFSASMSRGEAYQRVRLLHSDGKLVELPFLELGEELWDPSGTRLTLFFDPGRIKRGVKPREDLGPALEEGKTYTLVVDRRWSDARGNPLAQDFRKKFKIVAPDHRQPSHTTWKLKPPRAGTTNPLCVIFNEPLDEAMLRRVLAVQDANGKPLEGRIEIDREETRWRFHPRRPWPAGRHFLVADTTLEDQAGNSIGRPFEVDVFRKVERKIEAKTVKRSFVVSSGSAE